MGNKMKSGCLLILLFVYLTAPSQLFAQETNQPNIYTPPPLFGGEIRSEDITPNNEFVPPTPPKRAIEQGKPAPTITIKPSIKPKKNFAKPLPIPQKKEIPPSKGIVKGPKTMPAVKKQRVETEVIFEPKTKMPPNLTNRVKSHQASKKLKKEKRINPNNLSAEQAWNLIFNADGNTEISEEHKKTLLEKVIPHLDYDAQSRVFIESFATRPNGAKASLSADRRIALSRALMIRSYLLEQEILSNRIDMRAFGEDIGPNNDGKNHPSPSNLVKIKIVK
jgi:hypothetical protein